MSRKTITAPVTSPRRLWMGTAESSNGTSVRRAMRIGIQASAGLVPHGELQRLAHLRAGCAIDRPEHLLDLLAGRLLPFPTRHLFGHGIEIGDPAIQIGADDGIADGIQRSPRPVLLLIELSRELVALDDGVQCLGQQPVIAVAPQEIVVRALAQGDAGRPPRVARQSG